MPSWKKVVTSGSNAVLNEVTASKFIGDGSALTNLPSQTGTITALNNQSANRLVTIGSTTTELDGESNLTWNGSVLAVGTSSPVLAQGLHVKTTYINGVARFESGDAGVSITLADNSSPFNLSYDGSSDEFNFNNASSVRYLTISSTKISGSASSTGSFGQLKTANDFIVDSNGRVGINTTSPDYKLDVAGNIGMNEYLYHNGDTNTYLQFMDDRVYVSAGGDAVLDYAEDATSTLKLATNGEADVTIGTNHLFVGGSQGSYDAKVGIGNTTPSVALDVTGDIHASTYISGSAFVAKQKPSSMTGANNVDLSTSANHNITITGNITLTPTNFSARLGQSGIITLIQDSTGGHSITLNSLFKTPRGDSIAFDTTADGISLMSYYVIDASNVAVNYLGPFS